MSNLVAPPPGLMQRATPTNAPPRDVVPNHPAPAPEPTADPPAPTSSVRTSGQPTANGPYKALQQGARDVMDGTAACAAGVTQSPTASPYLRLKNTPVNSHDRAYSDSNAGRPGVEATIHINIPFATGGRQGVEVGSASVDSNLGPTGRNSATACVVLGVRGAVVNEAADRAAKSNNSVVRAAGQAVQNSLPSPH